LEIRQINRYPKAWKEEMDKKLALEKEKKKAEEEEK
jgi:hypothetical protein